MEESPANSSWIADINTDSGFITHMLSGGEYAVLRGRRAKKNYRRLCRKERDKG